jgi:3-phenylpropionate/cinnamic acid dioxygenase small subunit
VTLEDRIDRIESHQAIQQLPIRYAMAVDGRDVDAWVNLFTPDVQVGRDSFGRDALRETAAAHLSPIDPSDLRPPHRRHRR